MRKKFSNIVRNGLFSSTAVLALVQVAHAETADRFSIASVDSAQHNKIIFDGLNDAARDAQWRVASSSVLANVIDVPEITINHTFPPKNILREAYSNNVASTDLNINKQPMVLIANPNTPDTARDPQNVTGIGQMIVDEQNGGLGLCTGTLINPRTVLFAAHCVNNRAANTYGANSSGTPIAFAFETNTRSNAPGESDELLNWFRGAGAGPGRNRTNIAQALYNANYVAYDPRSLESNAQGFLYGDVAIATLDTPAANVPTWAMLFSALPGRPITAASGAGYHVSIAGYGKTGDGQQGALQDGGYRRRLAENFIGGLASINQFENFLFGGDATSNPQNLYWIDFDDPRRGTSSASEYDVNPWRDNAVPNGKEGITAPGDSGGPLILDEAYSTKLVLGVLSGGYPRFFEGQPENGYGVAAFYQPLYLYWDWVAANNGYHYVTSVAGDRDWTDSRNWVSTLDPNYYILDERGQLLNGVPTNLGAGPNASGNVGTWGQVCEQADGNSRCKDMSNGSVDSGAKPIGTAANNALTLSADSLMSGATIPVENVEGDLRSSMPAELEPQSASARALPPSTIANGLPNATNFVPNNFNGNRLTSSAPRYFDVTITAAGTTTLASIAVVDRFKISGAQSTLRVSRDGSLTSEMEINQLSGIVRVDGNIRSVGDYFFMSGLLTGTGTVRAPFLTSVMGNFAPGTQGTLGTLTVAGNLIMGSASTFAVDLGPSNTSDNLRVVANGTSAGSANVGGRVIFSPASGTTIRANGIYTILTAAGGVTGTFSNSTALTPILSPQFLYNANSVQVRIAAGSYGSVVANTPVQLGFAGLLDRNRGGTDVAPLYDVLDLQNAATIQATLESWAPRAETLKSAVGTSAIDNMNRFFRGRIASMDLVNGFGGSVATLGNPLQAVARLSDDHAHSGQLEMGYADSEQMQSGLPDSVGVYFAGGYLNGKSKPMATALPAGGDDSFDGYYIAAGIESEIGENAGIGYAFSYTDIDGTTSGAAQNATGKLFQSTLYGKLQFNSGLTLDGQFSAAMFRAETQRTTLLGLTTYRLQSRDDSLGLSSEVGLSQTFKSGSLMFGPRIALRTSRIEFTPTIETGGPAALAFNRDRFDSVQGMAGFSLSGGMKFRPYASAYFVQEFNEKPASFKANFVKGIGLPATFALSGIDENWFEASAGIAFRSETFELALGADSTIRRNDVSNQSYRGTVTFRF